MNTAESFVHKEIQQYDMPEIDMAIELIHEYRQTDWYDSKQIIIDSWDIDDKGIYELIVSIFTLTLTYPFLTYQTLVGLLNRRIQLTEELDRVKIIADVIGLVSKTGLIDILSSRGEYHKIGTDYVIEDIPESECHITVTHRPQPVEKNHTEDGHMILGNPMNRHSGYLRLAHLNRMNQIPMKLDQEFIREYEEAPKNYPDTETKEIQWEYFKEMSLEKYQQVGNKKFFLKHKKDFRGRTYATGYYITTQGNSFKKAASQLANPLIVEGD